MLLGTKKVLTGRRRDRQTEYLKKSLHAARTQRWQEKLCPWTLMVKSNIKPHSLNDLSTVSSWSPCDSDIRSKVLCSGTPLHCGTLPVLLLGRLLLLLGLWASVLQEDDSWDSSIFSNSDNIWKQLKNIGQNIVSLRLCLYSMWPSVCFRGKTEKCEPR